MSIGARRERLGIVLGAALILIGAQAVLAADFLKAVKLSSSDMASAPLQSTAVTGTDTVHVAFTENAGTGAIAMYRRSTDDGATWEDAVDMSVPGSFGSTALALEADDSTLDLVTSEFDADGNSALYHRTSANEGVDWSEPKRLTPLDGAAGKADVARAGDRVTIVWTDAVKGAVRARISTDGGLTFGHKMRIGATDNQPYPNLDAYDAWAAVDDAGGVINVAWKRTNSILRTRRSTDAGSTWSTPVTLSETADNLFVTLMAKKDKVAIGFTSAVNGHWRASLRRSTNHGETWRPLVLVGGRDSWGPIFELKNGWLRAAFSRCLEMAGGQCEAEAAFLRHSGTFGARWGSTTRLSQYSHTPRAFPVGIAPLRSCLSTAIYSRIKASGEQVLFSREPLACP